MATGEKGKPTEEGSGPQGALHIKMTTTDWCAVIYLKHEWERQESRLISISEILRRCVRQCAIVAGMASGEPPPAGGGGVATGTHCHHCEHLIDGTEYECPVCGRRCGRDIAALALAENDELLIVQPDGTACKFSELPVRTVQKAKRKKKAG